MGKITHASIGLAYPEDYRCALDFGDSPARFKEFMECRARFPDAIFCVIVCQRIGVQAVQRSFEAAELPRSPTLDRQRRVADES